MEPAEIDDFETSMHTPFDTNEIETRTREIGQQIFERSRSSLWDSNFWFSRMVALATSDPLVKTQLFRFVDVLPVLQDEAQKREHLKSYLSRPARATKWPLLLSVVSRGMKVPGLDRLIMRLADWQIRKMAENFIVGTNLSEAMPALSKSRRLGMGFTLDVLGEAVLSDEEAESYMAKYRQLIGDLSHQSQHWGDHPILNQSDLGPIPTANISIKISSLDCRMDPIAFETSLQRLIDRLSPLLETAVKKNVFVNFDMEQFAFKDLTRELFMRLLMKPQFRNYRHFGIVVQAYLRSSSDDVLDWIEFSRERKTPFTIRLVKGAYWDYEVIVADQNSWEVPVHLQKAESDSNYEHCCRLLLDAYPSIELAVGSHNVRSIAYALAYREARQLPMNAMEVQMLYGMADSFKRALVQMGVRVREYDPIGELIPGLSYLVRRLLENTSNDSFLKQSFLDKTDVAALLESPKRKAG